MSLVSINMILWQFIILLENSLQEKPKTETNTNKWEKWIIYFDCSINFYIDTDTDTNKNKHKFVQKVATKNISLISFEFSTEQGQMR